MVVHKADTGLWTLEGSRLPRSEGPRATNQPALPDKRSTGTDWNVKGDSRGMSKASRLQKSGTTKELHFQHPPATTHPNQPYTRPHHRRKTSAKTLQQVNKRQHRRADYPQRTARLRCCMQKRRPGDSARTFPCIYAKTLMLRLCLCACTTPTPRPVFVEGNNIFTNLFSLPFRAGC